MVAKMSQTWLSAKNIEVAVQFEPALVVFVLVILSGLTYRVLRRGFSDRRAALIRNLLRNLFIHVFIGAVLLCAYVLLDHSPNWQLTERLIPYAGLFTLIWGSIVFVKTCRIFAFEYLFLISMRAGVPVLLVNLLSLLLSLMLGGWILSVAFGVNLGSLLATSAVFSLILGLALQDTLGNLFSGVALQIDKPYEMGDWIELQFGGQKWAGQVHEISWRATVLLSFTEEFITIPNRTMGQAEISNFSARIRPVIRGQVFRIPYGQSGDKVRATLLAAIANARQVLKAPAPIVIITEMTDSWVGYKLVYYITDFGAQFLIADEVCSLALSALEAAGIATAAPRIAVTSLPQIPSH